MNIAPPFQHLLVVLTLACLASCASTPRDGQRIPPVNGKGMVWIEGGQYIMGCNASWALPEEQPARSVRVQGFWMDPHEVTNAQFEKFVRATGYVTTSEKATALEAVMANLPEGSPPPPTESLAPGSSVFVLPNGDPDTPTGWRYTYGADWRHPTGPGSSIKGMKDHPVVQVTWVDAMAYARWAGKALPTEAQWEFAARGGLQGARYVWGDSPPDSDSPPLNMWQGAFPRENSQVDGYLASAPVGSFPPNGFGLHDMAGNVWEWCADAYEADRGLPAGLNVDPFNPPEPGEEYGQRSLRGGSFLCSDRFCTRYRPSARSKMTSDSATNHTGFRCVIVPAQ
ncbi:MAG: formylglycine-generating enzyme family protein [Planctomycetota bacterium]|nr:formylglycine-generating enzyme family protein [Planctomycetota bacterium]